jgi:hypothetical protein
MLRNFHFDENKKSEIELPKISFCVFCAFIPFLSRHGRVQNCPGTIGKDVRFVFGTRPF